MTGLKLTLATVALAIVTLPAAAQLSNNGLQVKVPFAFSVEDVKMPAGTYNITKLEGAMLMIRSIDGKTTAAVVTLPAAAASIRGGKGAVIFEQAGNEYFLSKLWDANSSRGREFLKSRHYEEIARHTSLQKVAINAGQ